MRARCRIVGLVVVAFGLAACGGDPAPAAEPAVTSTTEALADWDLPPAEATSDTLEGLVEVPADQSVPDGEFGGEATFDELAEPSRTLTIDPCTLLDLRIVGAELGEPVLGPIVLENGAACGATDADDTARVALMVVPRGPGYRYLRDAERARAVVVDDPATGWWLTGSPVPASDQLVVELDDGSELVVEVSFRRAVDEADRRRFAIDVASEAFMRLPIDRPDGSFEEDHP